MQVLTGVFAATTVLFFILWLRLRRKYIEYEPLQVLQDVGAEERPMSTTSFGGRYACFPKLISPDGLRLQQAPFKFIR